VESTTKELTKYTKISALSQDFVRMATRWGKIIIEEFFLPPQCRTIDPCEVRGTRSGVKVVRLVLVLGFICRYCFVF
jgi:hypothetical protein